ncbi:hypothetical protein ACA910_021709 [Epithemia clementina (nom. ined.)]
MFRVILAFPLCLPSSKQTTVHPKSVFRAYQIVKPVLNVLSMSTKSNQPQPAKNSVDNEKACIPNDTTTKAHAGDATAVQAAKQILRKQVRAKLKALSREDILLQSQAVWTKLVQLPQYQSAQSVGIFLSMPRGEINTDGLIRSCVADGKLLYVPQVGQDFENAQMELLKVTMNHQDQGTTTNDDREEQRDGLFYEHWPKNKWNIPEPPASMPIQLAQPGDIDLLVVPGLAFDTNGNRLGQGKGYYDRFIQRMTMVTATTSSSAVKPLNLIGVCLDCQIIHPSDDDSAIPVRESDQRMQIVLSPSNTIVVV